MNPRDLAFMARLGFTARRAGYRIEVDVHQAVLLLVEIGFESRNSPDRGCGGRSQIELEIRSNGRL